MLLTKYSIKLSNFVPINENPKASDMKTEKQMAMAAAEFAERWKGRGYERGESQPFWIDLLTNVFGIETPSDGFITFEDHRMVDASNFIDGRK